MAKLQVNRQKKAQLRFHSKTKILRLANPKVFIPVLWIFYSQFGGLYGAKKQDKNEACKTNEPNG
jgi:hypothetical protein